MSSSAGQEGAALTHENRGLSSQGIQVRLFLTCWLIYLVHFSPFIVREHYLAMSLAERQSPRVDEYAGLHSDLFTIPGRGTFVGHNPGASFLAAVPYWLALPLVNRVAPVRPVPPGEPVKAEYDEQRPNRLKFYKAVRRRGLDIRLGLVAMITSVFFMAPLSAASAVVMYRILGHLGYGQQPSLWLSFLYALATPVFLRTGVLNLNLIVAFLALFAFVLIWWPSRTKPEREPHRYFLAGLLAGYGVLTDYTAVIAAGSLGLFALVCQLQENSFVPALKRSLWFVAGTIGPILVLLGWQWYCFGSPWLPAQYYGPKLYFSGYPSERGVGWPLPAALWGLLFDPLYGLLVFAPVFSLILYQPVLFFTRKSRLPGRVVLLAWFFVLALWIFCSCIHYTLRHQWQEGLRYMVPVLPFLFLLLADVLARMPRGLAYLIGVAAFVQSWCLAMVREAPLESMARVLLHGLELPWLTTLTKAAPQYFPQLSEGISPLPLFVALVLVLWGIWNVRKVEAPIDSENGAKA